MFAVKGWSVDCTTLKPQTEVFKSTNSTSDQVGPNSKKRKRIRRQEAKQDPDVRPDDVGRLWDQHVVGKKPSQTQKKRERKKHKAEAEGLSEASDAKGLGSSKLSRKERLECKGLKLEGKKAKSAKRGDGETKSSGDTQTAKKTDDGEDERAARKAQKSAKHQEGKRERHTSNAHPVDPVATEQMKLTPMQAAMKQKLISARFRHLNETLYTAPSQAALDLFDQNPGTFDDYHAGFRQQVSVWPENPVDNFVADIRRRGKAKASKLKQTSRKSGEAQGEDLKRKADALPRTNGACVIADLGCGDARLARTLKETGDSESLRLKILSYDLHSPSPIVTKADISHLPLADGSVDVAIFCLALMGTNWISFIEEAHRVLHWKGELWIAEIKSRFGRVGKAARNGRPVEHSVGGKRKQAAMLKAKESKAREVNATDEDAILATEVDGVLTNQPETDVTAFVEVLTRRGFVLKTPEGRAVDLSNKMFVKMEFVKAVTPTKGKGKEALAEVRPAKTKLKFLPDDDEEVATEDEATVLKPCLYKQR